MFYVINTTHTTHFTISSMVIQNFEKSRRHLRILGARSVTYDTFATKYLEFLGDLCHSLLSGDFFSVNEKLHTFAFVNNAENIRRHSKTFRHPGSMRLE